MNRFKKCLTKFFAIFKFIYTVLLHKYCILTTGLQINKKLKRTGLSIPLIRLLKHDLSKFHFSEFWPYSQYYYGEKDQNLYEKAWLHHLQNNDHHWEHYIENYTIAMNVDNCSKIAKEMKDEAILEMAADWISAEKAYNGKWPIAGQWIWAQKAIKSIGMNAKSKEKFVEVMGFLGFGKDLKGEVIMKKEN